MRSATVQRRTDGSLARHDVRRRIEEGIHAGKYPPGTRLAQQRLAAELGVSQSVVRESLFELNQLGLVQITDNLGAQVSDLDAATLLQAYDIREMLEALAARECCRQASRAEIEGVDRLAREIDELGREGRIEDMAALDREFHHRIVVLSGNELLAKLTETVRVLSKAIWLQTSRRILSHHHAQVVDAIRQNRPDEAERLMREHIRQGRRRVEEHIANGTFVPRWVAQRGRSGRKGTGGKEDAS